MKFFYLVSEVPCEMDACSSPSTVHRDSQESDYKPSQESTDPSIDSPDEPSDGPHERLPEDIIKDRKYVVFHSELHELFSHCGQCHIPCDVKYTEMGSLLTVSQRCRNCHVTRRWQSQPYVGNIPAGNILLSGNV